MGTDIEVTHKQVNVALRGILLQLSITGLSKGYNSLADAIEKNNMWDFLFNQAEVTTYLHGFHLRDSNIIRKLIHRRE